MENLKKILIIQTAFIGDVILTLPLIASVHNKYPGSHISVMITPKAYDLVKTNPYIDEIIVYDKNGKDKGFNNFLKLVKTIKLRKFDLALLPHRSLRSAMFAYSGKIPERIGFDRSPGKMFYTKTVKYSWEKHEVDRNLDLIGEKNVSKTIPIFLDQDNIENADRFLGKKDIIIGVAPGSVWATKRWSKERFAELIKEISIKYKAKIIIFGGEEDKPLAEEIGKMAGINLIIAAGKLSLGQAAAVISRCRLFITNDTAPLHIASAFKVPTVAIFGPTTTNLGFGPYGSPNIVVEKDLACRPCGRHGHHQCPEKHFKCMSDISTKEVFSACERLLIK